MTSVFGLVLHRCVSSEVPARAVTPAPASAAEAAGNDLHERLLVAVAGFFVRLAASQHQSFLRTFILQRMQQTFRPSKDQFLRLMVIVSQKC